MRSLYDIKQLFYRIHGKSLLSEEVDMFDALTSDKAAEEYWQRQNKKNVKRPNLTELVKSKQNNIHLKSMIPTPDKRKPAVYKTFDFRLNSDNEKERNSIRATPSQRAFVDKNDIFTVKPNYIKDSGSKILYNTLRNFTTRGFNLLSGHEMFAFLITNLKKYKYLVYRIETGSNSTYGINTYNDIDITSGKNSLKHLRFKLYPEVVDKNKKWAAANNIQNNFEITPIDIAYAMPLPFFGKNAFYVKLKRNKSIKGTELPTNIFIALADDSNKHFVGQGEYAKAFDDLVFFIDSARIYCHKIKTKVTEDFMSNFSVLIKKAINFADTEPDLKLPYINWLDAITYLANNIDNNQALNLNLHMDECAKLLAKHFGSRKKTQSRRVNAIGNKEYPAGYNKHPYYN